ncbi:hypothetical protein SNE40_012001 [Patella caerulea]|uniref:Lipase domain-containing protein n=1 Tax=Patella caerulea TaxID=87958 RepID=A0AAN8PV41_PATCE
MNTVFCLLVLCVVESRGFLWGSNEVCYDGYGCFNNKSPFDNTGDVPVAPADIALGLQLNNRANPDLTNSDYLTPTDLNKIRLGGFNDSLRLVLIIHGFHGSATNGWVGEMATELIEAADVNVICVDWHDGAKTSSYKQATANTRLVGKMISVLLKNINAERGIPFGRMHIIGHSLGAHIAGYAGSDTPGLGRITGLDPAGPRFENYDTIVRLDPEDAYFVDVIHSDDDRLHELGFGLGLAIGNIDFYPNGGENQPGCSKNLLDYISNLLDFGELKDQVACSHMRAIHLFISSIRRCTYTGYRCTGYLDYLAGLCADGKTFQMGYWLEPLYYSGSYYLQTSGTEPFC